MKLCIATSRGQLTSILKYAETAEISRMSINIDDCIFVKCQFLTHNIQRFEVIKIKSFYFTTYLSTVPNIL